MPLGWLLNLVFQNDLGTDPIQRVAHFTGEWALRFLWMTLAVSPMRWWFKWNWLQRFRRMLGLFTLFYAFLHLLVFTALILEWQFDRIYQELIERPYISVGAVAFMLLIPLGVTSLKAVMRRMGRRWLQLHRSIYLVALLAWVHLFWQVRSDYLESLVYGALLVLLMVPRIYRWLPISPPLKSQ